MYMLKRIWLDFKCHIGRYLYQWLQLIIIIYILSFEVMSMEQSYRSIYFVRDYSEDMYMYSNAMKYWYGMNDKTQEEYIEEIESIKGVKGVGYDISLWSSYVVNEIEESYVIYINDVMADITYIGTQGEWLTEAAYDSKYINVVVGSEMGRIYDIGDVFEITGTSSGETVKCRIIGTMQKDAGIVDLDIGGSDKALYQECVTGWEIYTNDSRMLDGVNSEEYSYGSMNLLISLEEEFDKEELQKYGNIYSLNYMENVSGEYFSKIVYWTIEEFGILIFVVLFGSFTVSYLILSKGMYATGVYSLLGQTKAQKVGEGLLMHMLIYISAVIVAYQMYIMSPGRITILSEGENLWTVWNTVFVVLLGIITSTITTLTSVCMIRKCPKDIMRVAKEMEG